MCAELLLKKPLLRPETEADGCWVGVGVGEAAGVVGWTANPVACFATTTAGVRTGNVLGPTKAVPDCCWHAAAD